MLSGPSKLPIHSALPELVETLKHHASVVLTAPPGAGKSTVVPMALLEAGLLDEGQLVMLEPRRAAARATACRMAESIGEAVGETVGYTVRFESRSSSRTRILVVTEGVLTRRLVTDPFLDGISVVILDEFHERSQHVDLALAFVRELLSVRDDLRLIVMSATLDAERVSAYLGDCPVVSCEGRLFPVTVSFDDGERAAPLLERAVRGARRAVAHAPNNGDVLVFMPGAGEIRSLEALLRQDGTFAGLDVVPLYGALPLDAQDRALRPGPRRRIVIATNIAETSLTIPGVTAVVDSGLKKEIRYDPGLGLDRLETVPISVDSVEQRAGRAGRLGPGWVLRLWSAHDDRARPRSDRPEITRVDAAPVLLTILAFRAGDPREYGLLDSLSDDQVEKGLSLLHRLGAVTSTFTLTPRGEALSRLPVHPRIGAILLAAAAKGARDLGAAVAALISERDILERPRGGDRSDPLSLDFDYRVDLLRRFEKDGSDRAAARRLGISFQAVSFVIRAKAQLRRSVDALGSLAPKSEVSTGRLLLAGFPDRVVRLRRPEGRDGVMVGGSGVRLIADLPEDLRVRYLLAVQVDAGRRGERSMGKVFQVCALTRGDLEAVYPDLMTLHQRVWFDRDKGGVSVDDEVCFLDLVLERSPGGAAEPEAISAVLAAAVSERFETVFKPDKRAEGLLSRLRYAAAKMPSLNLPDVTEAGIKALLPEICCGKRYLSEVAATDWAGVVSTRIPYDTVRRLDDAFPERWTVPSGRAVVIDYAPAARDPGTSPVLACRLQELFGLHTTPAIARGTIPLTLHLLAPNGRPCQVTSDLASFWQRTYAEVRKDLRGRYPKHYWPEDPMTAVPTQRVRPK